MSSTTTHYGFTKPAVNSATDEDLWGSELNDNWDLLDTTLDGIEDDIAGVVVFPIGSVMAFAGTSTPSQWLLCYGQAVSRATYSALFSAISTTYGVGDGSTTFNVPDLRGRVVAGQDDMGGTSANRLTDQSGGVDGDTLGDTGGSETHTLITSEMPAHTHDIDINLDTTADGAKVADTNGGSNGSVSTSSTGGGTAHNNVQPTIILNYIIYAGV